MLIGLPGKVLGVATVPPVLLRRIIAGETLRVWKETGKLELQEAPA